MKKRRVSLISCITLTVISFVFVCLIFTPAEAEASTDVIKLKFANFNPAQAPISRVIEKWAAKVAESTGGKVEVKVYHSQSLLAYRDIYRGIQSGIADFALSNVGGTAGIDPFNMFASLPIMGWDSARTATKVYHELRKIFPRLNAEYENTGVKIIWGLMTPPQQLQFTKKMVRVPDDIAGMKLLTGPASMKIANALGYVGIPKGPPDWYMSLERGIVEGGLLSTSVCEANKLNELLKVHTYLGDGGVNMIMALVLMNLNSWKKLPADIQNIITDLNPWIQSVGLDSDAGLELKVKDKLIKEGHKVIDLTPDEINLWADKTESVRTEWIAEMESKGLPGKELMAEAKRLIKLYNK